VAGRGGGTGSDRDVFGADFEAFVLIFPDEDGEVFDEAGYEVVDGFGEEKFGLLGGLFEEIIVVAAIAAAIFPVGDFVGLGVAIGPIAEWSDEGFGELVEGNGGLVAMDAHEAVVEDIAGEVGEDWGTAAGGGSIADGHVDEALLPDSAFVGDLGGEPEGADEWMGHAPAFAGELAEGLGAPAGEGEVIEVLKDPGIFLPEDIERRIRVFLRIRHGWMVREGGGREKIGDAERSVEKGSGHTWK
jgi:hypothetical protein